MIALFASTANAEKKQELINAFNTVLDDRVDFDALYETVLKEHQSNSMPPISWLNSKKRLKYIPVKNSLYWTAQVATPIGDYEFAIEMNYSEEEIMRAATKRGWRYKTGNKRQVLLENGLV